MGTTTYPYEYREEGAVIPPFFCENYGPIHVIPYYDAYGSGTLKSVEVGAGIPSMGFRYRNEETGVFYTGKTMRASINLDSLRKGYYEATYQAFKVGVFDVSFNIRFKVGNLATTPGTPTGTSSYVFDDTWLDQLESYVIMGTNHEIEYDPQGNPISISNFKFNGISYNHADLSWSGRELTLISIQNGIHGVLATIDFTYNDQGIRTNKTIIDYVADTTQTILYYLSGNKVIFETDGIYEIAYMYDYDDTLISFNRNGTDYFYIRNLQGDITAIIDANGTEVAHYFYDAYGNMTTTGESLNPYTYRGYRFDEETGLYYLNSRYYNPETGRFLSTDDSISTTGIISSTNLYSYCLNNPILLTDENGHSVLIASFFVSAVASFISKYVEDIIFNYFSGLRGKAIFRFVSSVESYISTTIGGGICGLINKLVPGSGKFLNAFLVPFMTQIFEIATGRRTNFDKALYLRDSGQRFATSMLSLGKDVPINGTVLNGIYAIAAKVIMGLGTTVSRAILKLIKSKN